MTQPIVDDLYCGLGGWADGFLAEGYRVRGYDIEAHDYGTGGYPGELCIRDVRSMHGSELKDATIIVGSSPCQEFSYRAMPWKRAKALPPPYLGMELFNAQFRIQREASEAAGRYIPLIVENVRGAQKWVGRARWNYGSFYLWGDVPALMPVALKGAMKGCVGTVNGSGKRREQSLWDRVFTGQKLPGNNAPRMWSERRVQRLADGLRQYEEDSFYCASSGSKARKAASAMIAKIPFPLAVHIAKCFKPKESEAVA